MKKNKIEGWLFDVDELGSGVALWIYDAGGKLHRLTHEFSPPIYVSGARDDLKRLSSDLWRRGLVTGGRWEKRREFWTGEEIEEIGRASCRERAWIWGVAGAVKKTA